MREFLIHINVQTERTDVDTDQIEEALMGAITVGRDHPMLEGLDIEVALAEEI